jgi:hypothetical protein
MPKSGVITQDNNSVRPYLRTLLCMVCAGMLAVGPAQAERGNNRQGGGREAHGAAMQQQAQQRPQKQNTQQDTGAAQAAQRAEGRYGGKALKVSPQSGGYGVRLLLPDGTVKNVTVDSGD